MRHFQNWEAVLHARKTISKNVLFHLPKHKELSINLLFSRYSNVIGKWNNLLGLILGYFCLMLPMPLFFSRLSAGFPL